MTREKFPYRDEEGVEVPFQEIPPETLRNMIGEFVTREWAEWGASGRTRDEMIDQVLRQLREKRAKIVFDVRSGTGTIVACR